MHITMMIYAVFLCGALLCQYEELRAVLLGLGRHWHLSRDLRSYTGEKTYLTGGSHSRAAVHLQRLLAAACSKRLISARAFLLLSALIGIGCGFTVFWVLGAGTALLTCVITALLPYVLLQVRLRQIRVKSSREGDLMVRELACNYQICGCNMKEAVELTAQNLENAPHARRLLLDLANGFNQAYTPEALAEVLARFSYALGTAWGKALANTIYFSQAKGQKVTDALNDLSVSLTKSRTVIEHANRENQESALILKYLVPASYLLTVFAACRFFGFTMKRFLAYQFLTEAGLRWFLIMVIVYGAGIVFNTVLSKERMDL